MPLFPTRGPSQGSRLYTNADLTERPKLGINIERPTTSDVTSQPMPSADGPNVDELLAAARGSLSRANALSAPYDEGEYTDNGNEEAVENYNSLAPSVTDTTTGRLSKLAQRWLQTRPQVIQGAAAVDSFIPGPLGVPGRIITGGEAAADLGSMGLSGAMKEPGRAGLDVLGTLMGVQGLKSVGKGLQGLQKAEQARRAAQAAATAAEELGTSTAAGRAAQDRYLARQLEGQGYKPGAVKKITGVRPGQSTAGSTQTGIINHSNAETATPISDIMEGDMGAFRRPQGTALDALRKVARPTQVPGAEGGQIGLPVGGYRSAQEEITAMRNLLRSRAARSLERNF